MDKLLFHKIKPATKNSTDQTNHGNNRKISFSPAPKFNTPSETRNKNTGVKNSGVIKMKTFLTTTISEPPFSTNATSRGGKSA